MAVALGIAMFGAVGCWSAVEEGERDAAAASGATSEVQAREVLATAEKLAASDAVLARAIAATKDGWWEEVGAGLAERAFTSPGWRSARMGPEYEIGARLPERADGAIEIGIGQSDRYRMRLWPEGASAVAGAVHDGRVVYAGAYPGTDVVVTAEASRVELLYVVREPAETVALEWRVELWESGTGRRKGGKESGFSEVRPAFDGGLEVLDDGGNVRLRMPRPYAIDARGERRDAVVAVEDGLGRVRVELDARGMAAPVLLDPAIEVGAWVAVGPPGARSDSALAYDAARGRTVLFGGWNGSAYLGDTWQWDGTVWSQRATTGPSARSGHALAYDAARQRTVLFGGYNSTGYLGDTWEWDGTMWSLRATTGPPARYRHALAFDTGRGRTVLFGGTGASDDLGDTWEWDGAVWSQSTSTGPLARHLHALAFDAARGRTVLFGGTGASSDLSDTWEWDGFMWSQRASTGPPARSNHGLAYDAARERTVLFGGIGGIGGSTTLGDTWEWDGTTWSLRTTTGPSARYWHALAYDAARQRAVLFGGINGGAYLGDTWEWDGMTWSLRASTGPSRRHDHALAYDAARQRTVLFGGLGGAYFADTWEWDGTVWTQRASTGPLGRYDHTLGYDAARGRTVLFGGWNGSAYLGDTWEWDGTVWTQRTSAGPSARYRHALAYDAARGRMVLFGGGTLGSYLGDTWEWDGTAWSMRASTGPSARQDHALAYDSARQRTVLFGGSAGLTRFGDTWEWDGTAWSLRAMTGPPPRSWHALAYDSARQRTVLFGGASGSFLGDTWEWDGTVWSQHASTGPPARDGHALAYDAASERTLLFGGSAISASNSLGDTWEYHRRGGPCASASDCEAGIYCADGACCDESACDTCEACNLAADPGICSPVTNAEDPDSCTAPDTCGPTGVCAHAIGATCATDDGCASGHCEEGVCCDRTCGICEACAKAKRDPAGVYPGITDGECGPVLADTDVDGDCARDADFPQSCRADGMCDGLGACRPFALSSVVCATASCDANANTAFNFFCAGDAAFCKPAAIGSSCFPGRCVALACVFDCASDADCDDGAYCGDDDTCKGGRADSEACERPEQCASGFCADGVCCNGPCKGQCEACDASGDRGVCVPVIGTPHGDRATCASPSCDADTNAWFSFACAGDRTACEPSALKHDCAPGLCAKGACVQTCKGDGDCADGAYCDAGACEFARGDGKTCKRAEQCDSGFCADGVCCNTPCKEQCEACDSAGAEGSCIPISGDPHGVLEGVREECDPGSSDDACSKSSCEGTVRDHCAGKAGPDTMCKPPRCEDGMSYAKAICDGRGACESSSPTSCGSYACGADACMTTCATDADCTGDATCVESKCIVATTCLKDGHTVQGPAGDHDCAPFRCDTSGTCLTACESTADCVSGALCTSAHECVGAPDAGVGAASSIGGCGCRVAGAPASAPPALWVLTLPLLTRLRRRRVHPQA